MGTVYDFSHDLAGTRLLLFHLGDRDVLFAHKAPLGCSINLDTIALAHACTYAKSRSYNAWNILRFQSSASLLFAYPENVYGPQVQQEVVSYNHSDINLPTEITRRKCVYPDRTASQPNDDETYADSIQQFTEAKDEMLIGSECHQLSKDQFVMSAIKQLHLSSIELKQFWYTLYIGYVSFC